MGLKESRLLKDKVGLNSFLDGETKKKYRFVGVMIPVDVYSRLEEIARSEERNVSQLIRLAVRKYLKEREDAEVKE